MRWRVGLSISFYLLIMCADEGFAGDHHKAKFPQSEKFGEYHTPSEHAKAHSGGLRQIFVRQWSLSKREHLVAKLAHAGIRVILVGDHVRAILPVDMVFNQETGEVKSAYYKQLNYLIEFVKTYGAPNIDVIGHSDKVATKKKNADYSEHLAEKIAAFFWVNGIPYERLHVKGVGDYHLVSDSPGGLNQRVEVQFIV